MAEASWAERVAEGGVGVLLVFSALALGSVSETATALVEGGCFTLLLLAWWGAGASSGGARVPRALTVAVGVFTAWTCFQVIPLPPSVLKVLCPGTHELYNRYLPGYGGKSRPADLQAWLLGQKAIGSADLQAPPKHRTGFEGRISIAPGWKPISWYPGVTLKWLSRLLAYWAFFVLAVRYLPERAWRKRLPWLVVVFGFGLAAFGIVQRLTWNDKIYWVVPVYQGNPFGPWVNNNHFSGYLGMIFWLGVGILLEVGGGSRRRSHRSRLPKQVLIVFFLIWMGGALVLAHSRGGLFALLLTSALFALLQARRLGDRKRHSLLARAAAVLPLLVVGIGILWYTFLGGALRPETDPGVEPSFAARVNVWKGILRMVAANPLSGTGLGTFGPAYAVYKTYGETNVWQQAHNDYLQLLAETGIIGFSIFLLGAPLFVFRFLLPAVSRTRDFRDPLKLAAALGVTTLLIHSFVDFNLQIPSNALLFVFLGALVVRSASGRSRDGTGEEGKKKRRSSGESPESPEMTPLLTLQRSGDSRILKGL